MARKTKLEKISDKALDEGLVIQTRITDRNDITKYLQWKLEMENNKKTAYGEIRNIIMKEVNNASKKDAFRKTKDDLFYYLRKAIFASMAPFKQDIDNTILDIKLEQNIINKKLDLLINLVAREFDVEKDLVEISGSLLKENKYFKDIKDLLEKDNEALMKKIAKANKKYQETFGRYHQTEFENDENIIDDIYSEVEDEKEKNI